MKLFYAAICLVVVVVGGFACFASTSSTEDSEEAVAQIFFELAQKNEISEAVKHWTNARVDVKSPVLEKSNTPDDPSYQSSVSYAEEVYRNQSKIVETHKFPGNETNSVLCVNTVQKDGRYIVYRLTFESTPNGRKIVRMIDADDILAAMHQDCKSFEFER